MLCGNLIPGTTGFSEGRLTGLCVLYAPFTIFGGIAAMSSDSITDKTEIMTALCLSATTNIPAEFSEIMSFACDLLCPLSAMDTDRAELICANAVTLANKANIPVSAADRIFGANIIFSSIGSYGFSGICGIEVPLGLTDIRGKVDLSLSGDKTFISTDALRVSADNRDVTDFLISAEIKLMYENKIPSVTAVFRPFAGISPKKLTLTVNDEDFNFNITSISQGLDGTTVKGAMPEPDGVITLDTYGVRASYHAAQNSGKIVWAAADYVAGDVRGEFSHFSLAQTLADNAGLYVRVLPSGYIVVSGDGTDITLSPDHIFTYQTDALEPGYRKISVSFGYQDAVVEAEESPATDNAFFRVYGYGCEDLSTEAESLNLLTKGIAVTITEDVYFTDGEAQASKPVRKMITAEITACGRKLYKPSANGYIRISYVTSYDRYSVHSQDIGKRSLTAFSRNTAYHTTDATDGSLSVYSDGLCDHVTAIKKAKSLANTGYVTTLQTSHNAMLTAPAGLMFSGAGIHGTVTSAKISIKQNPLIIKDILEVTHD